jgi:TetR/AcrR family transcriptional repressor of nem operon
MKISKDKAAENRLALVKAAGRLFRERGIDGVGVAEISKAAGLTHGALYAHFASKEALAAEALADELHCSNARIAELAGQRSQHGLAAFLDYYLSQPHLLDLGGGCAIAASASEVARQDTAVSVSFADGLDGMVDGVIQLMDGQGDPAERQRALAIAAAAVGAMAVARGVAKARPEMADEVLQAVRKLLDAK